MDSITDAAALVWKPIKDSSDKSDMEWNTCELRTIIWTIRIRLVINDNIPVTKQPFYTIIHIH